MTKNYFLNALSGALYVVLVASFMYYVPKTFGPSESVMIPIAILSLFVLSVCVMACLFGYQPVKLYLEGEKKAPLELLVKTVATFAGFTVLFLVGLFFSTFL
ncbi:MAG: hypothetical protein V4449_03320 [Patescibacteria group bacterium]